MLVPSRDKLRVKAGQWNASTNPRSKSGGGSGESAPGSRESAPSSVRGPRHGAQGWNDNAVRGTCGYHERASYLLGSSFAFVLQ